MGDWGTCFYSALSVEWFTFSVFVAWTLQRAWTFASEVLRAKSKQKRGTYTRRLGANDVLCPRLFGRLTTVQFTMGVTIGCIVFILLSMLLTCVGFVLILSLCGGCQLVGNPPKTALYIYAIAYFSALLAYILVLVTHFERIRLTFRNTTQRLPKYAPKLLYSAIVLMLVGGVVGFLDRSSNQMLAAISYTIVIVVYVATISGLITAFFKRTTAIAKSTEADTSKLTDTALRVAISATMSLLSTSVVFIYVIIWLSLAHLNNNILMSITFVFFCFDDAVNAFCLLCAFRQAAPYYHMVFGRLHAYCLSRLLHGHNLNNEIDQVVE